MKDFPEVTSRVPRAVPATSMEEWPLPVLTARDGGKTWELKGDYHFFIDGVLFTIPDGFETDGASTPFRVLITPLSGNYWVAALIHDYLYASKAVPRKKADAVFLQVMREHEVNPVLRGVMWLAVRWFGGIGWVKDLAVRGGPIRIKLQ